MDRTGSTFRGNELRSIYSHWGMMYWRGSGAGPGSTERQVPGSTCELQPACFEHEFEAMAASIGRAPDIKHPCVTEISQ
jgi:hypothetical protein